MEKFVPYEKKSKKAKRKYNAAKRKDWNGVNPNTKIVPDTHKEKKEKDKIKSAYDS